MFHYEEPVFRKKRLLRVEMLEQLRDYPKNFLKQYFQEYSNGIVCGCQVTWDRGFLEISPGIVYHGGKLYFMENPYKLECTAEDKTRYLKVHFVDEICEEGKTEGNGRIVLNDQKADPVCETELCRFRLQEGARLRDTYKDFEDYATEYDTINRIYVPFASKGQPAMWPQLLMRFAREMMESGSQNVYDVSFVMNILSNQGAVSADCVGVYLQVRLGEEEVRNGNEKFYEGLKAVLKMQERPLAPAYNGERRTIMLL